MPTHKTKLHSVQEKTCDQLHRVQYGGMNSPIRYIADSKGNVSTATPAFHHGHLTLKDMIDPSRTTVTIHESELTHNRRFREVSKSEAEAMTAEYAQ